MKSALLFALFPVLMLSPLSAQTSGSAPAAPAAPAAAATVVKNVDAAGAKKLLDAAKKGAPVTVLDIRTPEEFAEGHLAGAVNLDFLNKEFSGRAGALDKSATYLVHCQSGGRSKRSLEVFKKLGFKTIVHLDGGFAGWQKAALPVEK